MNPKKHHSLGVRLDDELYQQIKQMAHDDWRTLSSEIHLLLKAALQKGRFERLVEQQNQIMIALKEIKESLKK